MARRKIFGGHYSVDYRGTVRREMSGQGTRAGRVRRPYGQGRPYQIGFSINGEVRQFLLEYILTTTRPRWSRGVRK